MNATGFVIQNGLQQNTDPRSADLLLTPLLTPLKIIGKKIQSVVQIKFINIMLPEVPRMMGECCNGLTSIFCYKYSFHSQINEHKIS